MLMLVMNLLLDLSIIFELVIEPLSFVKKRACYPLLSNGIAGSLFIPKGKNIFPFWGKKHLSGSKNAN